jgi:hypothetical protein
VPALVRDPQPVEVERLLERRHERGQDVLDEVWEGIYHVVPVPAGSHAHLARQLAVQLGEPAR